jgi:Kef-type K+ transport system membrane component KefB
VSADALTARVLLDLALILILARAMGALFARLRQPPVIGEIVAGILLGPTLLGAIPGDPAAALFAPEVRDALRVVGQVALAAFMFTVGWSLDTSSLRRHERTAAAISLSSALVPFVLGVAIAIPLHRAHGVVDGDPVALLPFALFIGASMSITAFPVLARILVDRGMSGGRLGALVLTCAAVDDALGWMLVVVVLAVLASTGAWDCARIVIELAAFMLALVVVVRPALARALGPGRRAVAADRDATAVVLLAGALACAAVTELIGVHFVIGAFAFGLVVPRERRGASALADPRARIVAVAGLLLPVYFVLPGLNIDATGLTVGDAGVLAAIVALACCGKIGGAVAAARVRRVAWRDALTIGALMNTRGLIEIVVLTIGFEHGVLDRRLFTVMVLMAIATTMLTGPLLSLIERTVRAPDAGAPRRPSPVARRAAQRVLDPARDTGRP